MKPSESYVAPTATPTAVGGGGVTSKQPEVPNAAERVAVIVCHGMGQQVPFETIDAVARVLRKESIIRNRGEASDIATRLVPSRESYFPRAEIELKDEEGRHDVHIYECYWAPLTEGKLTLRDVHRFLLGAGVRGLTRSFGSFSRWMFGDWQELRVLKGTAFKFLTALAVLWSLTLMSVTIVAVAAARALTHARPQWPSSALIADLTIDLLIFAGPALILIGLLAVAWRWESVRKERTVSAPPHPLKRIFNILIRGWVGITVLASIASGVLILLHLGQHAKKSEYPIIDIAITRFLAGPDDLAIWTVLIVWIIVISINSKIRKVMVQYVGDVAAYVSAHTVSRFCEIRQGIQVAARSVAEFVYATTKPEGTELYYDRVVIVGHSLGSVVGYDTLNALLLRDDFFFRGSLQVAARTSALITFGSPLDKTAFIFREQQSVEAQVREALAANSQPLILAYKYRPPSWVNLWSPADWISGQLEYYDEDSKHQTAALGSLDSRRVQNIEDTYSSVPLLAHVMYWQSPLFAHVLYNKCCGR